MSRGPVLAVCGRSGSGRSALLAGIVPRLVARGLAVAACRQAGPAEERSDELFPAGTDVVLEGPGESRVAIRAAVRTHFAATVTRLLGRHDVVLVGGDEDTPLPKVWLAREDAPSPPAGAADVMRTLAPTEDRAAAMLSLLDDWLPRAWREAPVLGGVLVGGGGRRMGRPKQLLELGGRTFVERAIAALEPSVEEVFLLGDGEVPGSCAPLVRLPDPPDVEGPLAGILAALRRTPGATWVIAGCDQPLLSPAAVAWLLDRRTPGKWAILPRNRGRTAEPFPAVYDGRARWLLESLAAAGCLAPSALAGHDRTLSPVPDPDLSPAWRDVDTPEELAILRRELG
jgi:molybdopterin-guanine dinucleotide biosynthesis protein MobB